jgi:hypothetical protein
MKDHEQYFLHEVTSLESEHKDIITKYRDAAYVMKLEHKVLSDVLSLARYTPVGVGESKDWVRIVHGAKQDRRHLCKALH